MEKAIEKINSQSKGNPVLMAIGDYLSNVIKSEPAFAEKVMNEKKSMKEMLQYVMSEAKKQAVGGAACLKDETVFGLAVHYFDEEDLKFTKVSGIASKPAAVQKPVKKEVKHVEKPDPKPVKKQEEKKQDVLMSIFDFM